MRLARPLLMVLLLGSLSTRASAAPVDIRENMPTGPLLAGQLVTDASNGAEALATSTPVKGLRIKNSCDSGAAVMFGGAGLHFVSAPGWILLPCDEEEIPIDNLADVFVDSGAVSVTVEYYGVQN